MMDLLCSAVISLPSWVLPFVRARPADSYATPEARMQLAIDLARENVLRQTGGPFGAAVFESASGKLISVGVNVVVASTCSLAHAEVVAIMLAQQRLLAFDLGAAALPAHELVASAQMCAQCYGSSVWSGVRSVLIGASAADTEELTGFDEGPIPKDWAQQLISRGIAVKQGVLREAARDVLSLYRSNGGTIYNGRGDDAKTHVEPAASAGGAGALPAP